MQDAQPEDEVDNRGPGFCTTFSARPGPPARPEPRAGPCARRAQLAAAGRLTERVADRLEDDVAEPGEAGDGGGLPACGCGDLPQRAKVAPLAEHDGDDLDRALGVI